MFNNKFTIAAYSIGFVLINIVYFVPVLNKLFKAAELGWVLYGLIYLLAFGSMAIIQLIKLAKIKTFRIKSVKVQKTY